MTDIIVIGAGVTGCGIARELSRYDRKVTVLERGSDVCEGTSKANSGIVHAGFDAKPGTLKARLNVAGNEKMEQLARELDFPFKRNGSLVLCFEEADRGKLQKLYEQGIANGVKELRIVEREELKALEPHVSDRAVCALYAPTGGIVCPFGLTIALAENAAVNGVDFRLNTKVLSVEAVRTDGAQGCPEAESAGGERPADGAPKGPRGRFYRVTTDKGVFEAKVVINAAGVYADRIHNMISRDKIKIVPRKGEYCLMDKKAGGLVSHTIFQLPTVYGKGVLVTPTVHGNLLVGPNAVDEDDPEGVNTTAEGLADVAKRAGLSVENLPLKQVITSFAGLRAHLVSPEGEDFCIGPVKDAPGFFDAAGIESPGLSCAPVIGEYVARQVLEYLPAEKKKDFIATRKGIPSIALATDEERQALIRENPLYANVICRCELVTEGEIVDAIRRPLGATTLDGIKRRVRAGMGRCQAGFCSPGTVEILARELGKDMGEITKNDSGSEFFVV